MKHGVSVPSSNQTILGDVGINQLLVSLRCGRCGYSVCCKRRGLSPEGVGIRRVNLSTGSLHVSNRSLEWIEPILYEVFPAVNITD